jgi:hypothetical protein
LIDAIKSKTFKLGVKENLEILGVWTDLYNESFYIIW